MSTTTLTTALPTGTWAADTTHSSIGFSVRHMGVSTFKSRFTDYDAVLVAGSDGALRLDGTVRVASIDIATADLKGHLLSDEFFGADRTPELRFRSSKLDVEADGRLRLEGDLEIRGVSLPVIAEGSLTDAQEDASGGTRAGLVLTAVVDRREYGLEWNMPLPKGGVALGNDVTLAVELELVLQEG